MWVVPRKDPPPEPMCEVVERALDAQLAQLTSSVSQLNDSLDSTKEALTELGECNGGLSGDLARKEAVTKIDNNAGALQRPGTSPLGLKGGTPRSLGTEQPITPTQWRAGTAATCRRARDVVRSSVKQRTRTTDLLVELARREEVACYNLLHRQRRAISNLKCALSELERKLSECQGGMEGLEAELSSFENILRTQEESNLLTQERLVMRSHDRPPEELVQDIAQVALQRELNEGVREADRLRAHADRIRGQMNQLGDQRADLEAQHAHKNAWLKLELKCAETEIISPMWETLHDIAAEGQLDTRGSSQRSLPIPSGRIGHTTRLSNTAPTSPFKNDSRGTTGARSPGVARSQTPDLFPSIP